MFLPGRNVKIKRNEPCFCGSGKKYKKCWMGREASPVIDIHEVYRKQHQIKLKNDQDIEGIRKCGVLVVKSLEMAENNLRAGMTTMEINNLVHDYTIEHHGRPAPLNYRVKNRKFRKSTCISVNEVICHGIPGKLVVNDGDIVNVDITTELDGYFADANRTFFVGTPGEDAFKITNISRQALFRGIEMVKPGNTIGDIGWAIQDYVEKQGASVVRSFVGHGVGFKFHEPPVIPHFGKQGDGLELIPGMVFTIEPMINLGKSEAKVLSDKWTAVTKDGSLSAQFEQTVVVTSTGVEILTPFD